MSVMHQSIATINSPQFINLQPMDINPLMSSCEIKVLYIGENRNRSFISKQVATEMAKTLRGAPIVGYYKKDKQDFADHGEQMILDDEGIHFNCLTKPYGFVAPNAQVWFQDFEDFDEFGNSIVRTYLMTNGYLWTGQFEEAAQILKDNGKPQSMELEEKSLEGHWSKNIKEDMEFFIINDAIFSKLCILGDDVEPCFEGASILEGQPKTSFTIDNEFKHTLFQMMQELKDALEGGKTVADVTNKSEILVTDEVIETENVISEFTEEEEKDSSTSSFVENQGNDAESTFVKEEKEEDEEDAESTSKEGNTSDDEEDDEEDDKEKYTALQNEYQQLQADYSALTEEVAALREFKESIENERKDDLIAEFYMLSDEDKRDVIANKSQYSLEEIKSKLAVICFEKKVNFNLEGSSENEETVDNNTVTFNVNYAEDSTPDWIKAVESTMNSKI